jgi:hypothetical protein
MWSSVLNTAWKSRQGHAASVAWLGWKLIGVSLGENGCENVCERVARNLLIW